ncbi:GlcG/HbpS family heme-binding protein [Microbacterium alcoholitolerans]|uniref:GlcG/HbpS family heme-binding protein n=1 Tax=unclassified Microbacterium TaxID=2609290 RepID=UPI003D183943
MTASPIAQRSDISAAAAQRLIVEVHDECTRRGIRLAAAVVDSGGNLVAAARMDGAQLGALGIAQDKAYTAVSFGFPTRAWMHSSAPGGTDWGLSATLGGRAVVFPGGVPIYHEGTLIGGLGVSGAASEVDEACALAALGACGLESAS